MGAGVLPLHPQIFGDWLPPHVIDKKIGLWGPGQMMELVSSPTLPSWF